MKKNQLIQLVYPILLSPLLLVFYYYEEKLQYTSQFFDQYLFPASGAIISILLLVVYRRYWQYLLSSVLMAVVTIFFGHMVLMELSFSKVFSSFDSTFAMVTLLDVVIIHGLACIGFWFLKGIMPSRKKTEVASIEQVPTGSVKPE